MHKYQLTVLNFHNFKHICAHFLLYVQTMYFYSTREVSNTYILIGLTTYNLCTFNLS